MIIDFLKNIFSNNNKKLITKYQKIVTIINELEYQTKKLTNFELKQKTFEFKKRITNGEKLNNLLPEVFSVCREASLRVQKMRHFDVQLIGGIVLHYGKIAEMYTGEGKTLVATLAAYLNALSGNGVHIITVNDYLAQRDAEWMGKLYYFLGLSVGINLSNINNISKKKAYSADITYGTNNEFGFDYLRDNMIYNQKEKVQKKLNFAIIDEVDSILIDEARTPLIISDNLEEDIRIYKFINKLPKFFNLQNKINKKINGDYILDEKSQQILLNENGYKKAEKLFIKYGFLKQNENLYTIKNIKLIHYLNCSLRAHKIFKRNEHYIIKSGEVIIVDEFTGRLVFDRRWSDGLHQAIEAKENVQIQNENKTLASITLQNYFKMYNKLSGMTGTAYTEINEFKKIYGLDTVIIPPNKKSNRIDKQDKIYKTSNEKYHAVVKDIIKHNKTGQPILVGTTSIENSELISKLLKKIGLKHNVLNAKNHKNEAKIIAKAGNLNHITIATNMAGRGTDIILGGNIYKQEKKNSKHTDFKKIKKIWNINNKKIKSLGGLYVIGTERHESRRIDNQLRGRTGRQGDPGLSCFYLSLDDKLLRIFSGEKIKIIMENLNIKHGKSIKSNIITNSIESAQYKVELYNFDIRKQLFEYDDILNDQRRIIYLKRNNILKTKNINKKIKDIRFYILKKIIKNKKKETNIKKQNISEIEQKLKNKLNLDYDINFIIKKYNIKSKNQLLHIIFNNINNKYYKKNESNNINFFYKFEKIVLLYILDIYWRNNLFNLEYLRQSIHFRGYAQKNPKQEYQFESFKLFVKMLYNIRLDTTYILINTPNKYIKQINYFRDNIYFLKILGKVIKNLKLNKKKPIYLNNTQNITCAIQILKNNYIIHRNSKENDK